MPGLTDAASESAWTYGAAIMTFVVPMLLFLIVAAVLWILFTKPQVVPGHSDQANGRSVCSTRVAGPASEVGPAASAQAGRAAGPPGPAGPGTGPGTAAPAVGGTVIGGTEAGE